MVTRTLTLLVTCLSWSMVTALMVRPPLCSMEGLKIGAGLGSVAGAVGGVAATGGAATLATCPQLMISTLGHGLVSVSDCSKLYLQCHPRSVLLVP